MVTNTERMELALHPAFIEGFVSQKLNPTMGVLGLFKPINLEGSKYFEYYSKDTSFEDDILNGILSEPAEIEEDSELPQIQVSGYAKHSGHTVDLGLEMNFTEELLNQSSNYDLVLETYKGGAYSINRVLNRWAYNGLMANATAETITLNDGAWATSEKIAEDVMDMQEAIDKLGYHYSLTDMYVGKTSFYGARKYEFALGETFTPEDFYGSALHKFDEVDSGLLGLDMNAQPAKWYYNVDPNHNRLHNDDNPASSIINVHVYDSPKKPFSKTIQMWINVGFAVQKSDAVMYVEGV